MQLQHQAKADVSNGSPKQQLAIGFEVLAEAALLWHLLPSRKRAGEGIEREYLWRSRQNAIRKIADKIIFSR